MLPIADTFEYDYRGCAIRYGRGRLAELEDAITAAGRERALVVCGSNVGANETLMEMITAGIGDRLVGVFDETTPAKRIETAYSLIDRIRSEDSDALVAVGGGSSLDIARQACAFTNDDRSIEALRREARSGSIRPPTSTEERPAVIAVPTTLAGADISAGGSLEVLDAKRSPTGQPITVSGSAMPWAVFADPDAVETTPPSVLAGSAMNGFNKGIETLYARDASPISDALAVHGLSLLSESLPNLYDAWGDADSLDRAVAGMVLVQLHRKISFIHAIGHGFARRYDVQQGAIHAILAPHALEVLFASVDANRRLLARGLGIDIDGSDDDAIAEAVIAGVTEIRDSLEVATRLRELPEVSRADFPAIARFIVEDPPMERCPRAFEPTAEDIERMLERAW